MRTLINIFIISALMLSCSTSNKDKEGETNAEPSSTDTSESNSYEENSGLIFNPELIMNAEEDQTFNSISALTIIPIENYTFDLDSDGKKDKIEIFNFKEYEGDPGDFNRIRIELANGKVLDEFNLGIRGNTYMPTKNEIESDLISIVNFGDMNLLMTYGWYFASDPPQLTIFEFSSGSPRRIFAQNFEIKELVLSGSTILTGYKYYSESGPSDVYELRIEGNQLMLKNTTN